MSEKRNKIEILADSGNLGSALAEYLEFCRKNGEAGKPSARIPNVAGFCRFANCSTRELDALARSHPEEHSALCTALEDEALNSPMSATVLSAYLKLRLGYSGERTEESSVTDSGQLRLVFDHDAFKDGE